MLRLPIVLIALCTLSACTIDSPTSGDTGVDGTSDVAVVPYDVSSTDAVDGDEVDGDDEDADTQPRDTDPVDSELVDTWPTDTDPSDTGPPDAPLADTPAPDTTPTDAGGDTSADVEVDPDLGDADGPDGDDAMAADTDTAPDLCEGFVCPAPPLPGCDGDRPVTYTSGACEVVDGSPACPAVPTYGDACVGDTACFAGVCSTGYIDIDVGGAFQTAHACAVRFDGTIRCWGSNAAGQLGPDGPEGSSTRDPVLVPLEVSARQVACGANHTCALSDGGDVWCWGANPIGQLGDDAGTRATPGQVAGLPGPMHAIAAGGNATWALSATGEVWAWGGVPPNDVERAYEPRLFASGVTAIDAGRRAAVFHRADTAPVYVGDLGTGIESASTLSDVPFGEARGVGLGWEHGCAVSAGGSAACFGRDDGRAGDGTPGDAFHRTPVAVSGLGAALDVAVAASSACALVEEDQEVWCWGFDDHGSLGRNDTSDGPFGARVTRGFLRRVVEIEAGWASYLVRTSDGRVWSWGYGETRVLGDRGDLPDETPNPLSLP